MQEKFNLWLDNLLLSNPLQDNFMAINFNIYDINEDTYDVQLIASSIYDENDDDWACEEIYTSGEDCFFMQKDENMDHEIALETVMEMVGEYINCGKFASTLKSGIAICAGFVDGDIDCIWNSDDEE